MKLSHASTSFALALGLSASGCPADCGPSPDSAEAELWTHDGADAGDTSCTTQHENEPNESVSEANPLGETAVCTKRVITGAVADDVDVFYTWGEPCDGLRPFATMTSGPADLRFCFFVSCSEGRTALDVENTCPGGKAYKTIEGLLGCCRTGPGTVEVHVNCDAEYTTFGTVPELDGYLYVDRTEAAACDDYGVAVQF